MSIIPPDSCTGCALCANVCNKNAISMVWNPDGFLVPAVDTQACVNCGLCVKMCPAQSEASNHELYAENIESVVAYGAWNMDIETHQLSSSGGVFSALAKRVFTAGGCVFGVIWKDKVTASFAKAENMEELAPMRGSKYTQAEPMYVYRDVKTELIKGRQVLFTGTPCQIHALKKYLRRDYKNLLTCDIVCHGVPSRKLLQAYVKHYEHEQEKELKEVNFRFKDGNWLNYKVQKRFIDGSVLKHVNTKDMFMYLFIEDYILNKACYNCQHAHFPRPSDATLGDYWGNLHILHPDWPIEDGIGSVVVNSEKGEMAIKTIATENAISLQSEHFINIYNGQKLSYIRPSNNIIPKERESILKILNKQSLSKTFDKYYNYTSVGPLLIRKRGYIHRIYLFFRKMASAIKKYIFQHETH